MRLCSLLGLVVACGLGSAAAALHAAPSPAEDERGFPLIQVYDPPAEEVSSQFFGIAQDPRGLLYLANLNGVVLYDGARWKSVAAGSGGTAFSLATDAGGRVAVGGHDDFGYLAPDERGTLRFVSLRDLGVPKEENIGQLLRTHARPEGFVFLTTKRLLLWDGKTVATVARFPGDRPLAVSFEAGNELYLWTRQGIMRLAGRRLVTIPGGERFPNRVDLILPADRGLLVSVRGGGLFRLEDGVVTPFAPEASRWTAEKRLFAGCRLADGRWVLGSVLGGVLLLHRDGTIDQVIDTSVGLPDDFVTGAAVDREGSLWLALDKGLARIEVASPVSVIDRRSGILGRIHHLARHRGELWLGTPAGLFKLARGDSATDASASRPVEVLQVPGMPPAAWFLLSRGDDLLVATAFGVYELRGDAARLIPGTEERTAFFLEPSARDPARVWIGFEEGLAAIRRDAEGYRLEADYRELREVRTIAEGQTGVVWCGTTLDGVVGAVIPAAGPGKGKPVLRRIGNSSRGAVFKLRGQIVVALEDGLRVLDERKGILLTDPRFAALGDQVGTLLTEDASGYLWTNNQPVAVGAWPAGSGVTEVSSLAEIPARELEAIVAEPDGVVWLAAENGLFRYAGPLRQRVQSLPVPLFSRISAGGDLLFGGSPHAAPAMSALPPTARRLRIEVGPLSFLGGLRYQTRLDPLDTEWSRPGTEPFAELTRLGSGAYTFRVRTLGPRGETGPEASWPFRVAPPWYQTSWALTLALATLAGSLFGYVRIRGHALRQRATELERRVAAQTEELQKTVSELRRAHTELAAANTRLEELSLTDELTGVANRRQFQQALAAEWSRAERRREPIALILLDLDHFKLLNDTRGHPEGDLCLQTVARYLAASVRQTGELVARYGGEELAVLLPETDLEGATARAERLRQGIERLAFPHDAVAAKVVTASFGVAARVPQAGEGHESLIEEADLALYQAKTEGRNRVASLKSRSALG